MDVFVSPMRFMNWALNPVIRPSPAYTSQPEPPVCSTHTSRRL